MESGFIESVTAAVSALRNEKQILFHKVVRHVESEPVKTNPFSGRTLTVHKRLERSHFSLFQRQCCRSMLDQLLILSPPLVTYTQTWQNRVQSKLLTSIKLSGNQWLGTFLPWTNTASTKEALFPRRATVKHRMTVYWGINQGSLTRPWTSRLSSSMVTQPSRGHSCQRAEPPPPCQLRPRRTTPTVERRVSYKMTMILTTEQLVVNKTSHYPLLSLCYSSL